MRVYNPMTVLRQTSRSQLKAFFAEQKCLDFINFEKDKFYELQDAFRTLPEKTMARTEAVMRNVFDFAGNDNIMFRVIEEARRRDIRLENDIENMKSRYDQAFYLYLHHRDLWEQSSAFLQVDSLPSRHWCRCPNLPRKPPMTDRTACDALGKQISAFFWQKQVRGKKYLIEYQRRNNGLHYYFVYLSDYSNSYETWSEQGAELELKNETRVISMVFAYDEQFGTLDTYNLGGSKIAIALQKMFCDVMLGHDLVDKQVLRSAFDIDRLKFRRNKPVAMPQIGITRAKILCMGLDYEDETKNRRTHRITVLESGNDEDIYDSLENDFYQDDAKGKSVTVRFVRILLDIELNGVKRRMTIELTRNSCTLKSNSDDLRKIGELFIQENRIDGQPYLPNFF